MERELKQWLPVGVIGIGGFGLGQFSAALEPTDAAPQCMETAYQETAIVQLQEIEGDELKFIVNGPVRLVWNNDYREGDGEHMVPLGQLPNETTKKFDRFAYVGNQGSMKFYPSNTYPARGTDPAKRRFFETKEAALKAGFVASKLVK